MRPWQQERPQSWRRNEDNGRRPGELPPKMLRALSDLARSPMYWTPDGWTLGDGHELYNSHTIKYLAFPRGLVIIEGGEARLSAAGIALYGRAA